MRTSITSSSSRAATWLCTACRRQALEKASFPRIAGRSQRDRATAVQPTGTSNIGSRRWLSQTHNPVLRPAAQPSSASTSAPTSASASTTEQPRYYALFPETLPSGAPPAGPFAIDIRALRREFLRLQAGAHPDFHHAASGTSAEGAAARRRAEGASAQINGAFKTLASPLLRAEYLLHELYSVDLAGDERGAETAPADPEVLMTVLEAREAVEEAAREEDLAGVRAENERRIADAEEALARAFAESDVEAAKAEAVRLRYWMNIRESVDNWERGKPVVLQH